METILVSFFLLLAGFPKESKGGAMQLSFTQITVDYYPYHRAGMGLK